MFQKRAAKGRLVRRVVIGVFGNKQHGKDTFAIQLVERLRQCGTTACKFALADPLKRAAMELLGMPMDIAFGDGMDTSERENLRNTWEKYGKSAREWLQWVGTELGREQIDKDIWIDRAVDTVINDIKGNEYFVISDCRFHNERVNLKRNFELLNIPFIKVRIHRPGVPVKDTHPSEAEVASMPDELFDHVIMNDGGLDQLDEKVGVFVQGLLAAATSPFITE